MIPTKETINNENIYIRDYIHLDCLFYHSLQDQQGASRLKQETTLNNL